MWKIRRFILSLFLRLPSRRHIRLIKYIKFDIVLSPLNETINYISKKKAKMVPPRSPFTDAINGGMSDKVVKPKIKKHKLPLLGLSQNASSPFVSPLRHVNRPNAAEKSVEN